jgi:hypothetical protein
VAENVCPGCGKLVRRLESGTTWARVPDANGVPEAVVVHVTCCRIENPDGSWRQATMADLVGKDLPTSMGCRVDPDALEGLAQEASRVILMKDLRPVPQQVSFLDRFRDKGFWKRSSVRGAPRR